MHDQTLTPGVYMAEFSSAAELNSAVRVLSGHGYTLLETYSPVPLTPGIPRRRSRLPIVVFIAGLLGGAASYAIQWYANVYSYPLDIGGRPAHAVPAFLIATFEGTVLCASLAAFVGLFVVARLTRPWNPVFEIDGFERATIDRYWLAVNPADKLTVPDPTPGDLRRLSPLRIVRLETQS